MMRDVKFRAFDKANNEMVNFSDLYIELEDGCLSVFKLVKNVFGAYDHFELDTSENNLVLMQCTGLRDQNNDEIYEGDMLKFKRPGLTTAPVYTVNWRDGTFCLIPVDKDGFEDGYIDEFVLEYSVVVGNIYENAGDVM